MANMVKITFEVEDKNLQAQLEKIKSGLKGADDSVQKMAGSLRLIKWDAIVNLGRQALQTATSIYNMARSAASAAGAIARAAEITGVTTEEIQKLQYAAKMCDVSNEELAMGLKFLARNMGDAVKGTGEARYYFEALGITMEDLKSKSPVPVLLKIADAFARTEDSAGKSKYAQELLGRATENLIILLSKGSAGIKNYGDEAVKMGTILGDVVVKKGSEAEEQFKKLEATVNAFKISLGASATEFLKFAEKIVKGWQMILEAVGLIDATGIKAQQEQIQKLLELKRWLKYAEEEAAKPRHWYETENMYGKRVEEWKRSANFYRTQIREIQESWKISKETPAPPGGKPGLRPVTTDEERRQQADLAKERMAKAIEQIKAEEAIEQAHIQTQLIMLERSWSQNLISEQEYLGRKKDLEESAVQFSIALSAKETGAITDGYREIIKILQDMPEAAKAREERERALQAVRNENLIRAEKLAQIGIQADTAFLDLTKQITIAESEGRLKVMEEEINKQRELNDLKVGLGIMRPGQAMIEELDAAKRITEERIRHLEIQRSLEPSAEGQKTLTADILALNIQLEDVEKRRLKLLPEFGTFQEGFKTGVQQYVASLGSAFQQAADLARNILSGMENAFSDFFESLFDRAKSWRERMESLLKGLINSIIRALSDAAAKALVGNLFGGSQTAGSPPGWTGLIGLIGSIGGGIGGFLKGAGGPAAAGAASGYHEGKGPGEGPTFYRLLPRFHSGIGPDEVLSIIRKDESVLTPAQMKALAPAGNFSLSSSVTVNWENNREAQKLHSMIEDAVIDILKKFSR